jgi:hypothetical protein
MAEGQIFNAIVEFFEEDEWDFHWVKGMPVLSMGFNGKNGKWLCYAQAREDQQQFVFYSVCPINVPGNRRQSVAEFITRANYGMIIGNFEMDFNDGEVRYKTSIDVEGDSLRPPLIKQMVYANVIIMDRYLPGIMAVIYGNRSPEEEIFQVEGFVDSAMLDGDVEDDDEGLDDLDDFEEDDFDIDDDDIEDIDDLDDLDALEGYDDDDEVDDLDDDIQDHSNGAVTG